MFAQIGANRFVRCRNPGFRRNYFQAVAGVRRTRAQATRVLCQDCAMRASPTVALEKTLEKSSFVQRRFARGGNGGSSGAFDRGVGRPTASPSRRPPIENNSAKVLTPEKTVIRFRPADVTCGRE
jgi:hypothetical protein